MQDNNRRKLEVLIKARYPIVYIPSWEEERVTQLVNEIANEGVVTKNVYVWNVAVGLKRRGMGPVPNTHEPLAALEFVEKYPDPAVFIFKDLHAYMEGHPVTIRKLRNLANQIKKEHKTVILTSPVLSIPVELQKAVTVMDFSLPTLEEIGQLLETFVTTYQPGGQIEVSLTAEEREKLIKAAQGLTMDEVENAFAKAVVTDGKLTAADIELILEEKRQIIRKTGLLEYYPVEEGLEQVGGLDNLKEWFRKRARSFTSEAQRFGLPAPKGILLTGMPGCGKSLCAKAVSSLWRLPLLRLDMGRIFAGIVGSSEENMRKAIQTAEAIAPCILWVDEIEKGFSGTGGSGDSGVTARVFGTFLTWMQEKTSAVFVFATANNIEKLPPELLRKGRFDEIFFVDLFTQAEREQIFRIHLEKRHKDPQKFDLVTMARNTEGYSGSEIEQAVITGMLEAFDAQRDLTTEDLLLGIARTVPLSRTMRERLDILRAWAEDRAVMASRPEEVKHVEPEAAVCTQPDLPQGEGTTPTDSAVEPS
ncbi:MAG: AAA family ATPase [Bacillota bacterium]